MFALAACLLLWFESMCIWAADLYHLLPFKTLCTCIMTCHSCSTMFSSYFFRAIRGRVIIAKTDQIFYVVSKQMECYMVFFLVAFWCSPPSGKLFSLDRRLFTVAFFRASLMREELAASAFLRSPRSLVRFIDRPAKRAPLSALHTCQSLPTRPDLHKKLTTSSCSRAVLAREITFSGWGWRSVISVVSHHRCMRSKIFAFWNK